MITIIFRDPAGKEHAVAAQPGQSVMHVALQAQIPGIEASCGGNCVCATCHCFIDSDWAGRLAPADEIEAAMLEATNEPRPTSRLTCQIAVTEALDGLRLEVAPSQH